MPNLASQNPRSNSVASELRRKRGLLRIRRIAKLTAFVRALRRSHGADRVPDFDPTEAGTNARILILLEAPGPRATKARGGSGFVSADNNDGTAENLWHLLREAGIDRTREIVTWNVVPWYIGTAQRIRAASSKDIVAGRQHMEDLRRLLPRVRVVVLLGRSATKSWKKLECDLLTIECPHPSPRNLNVRKENRSKIRRALRKARRLAGFE